MSSVHQEAELVSHALISTISPSFMMAVCQDFVTMRVVPPVLLSVHCRRFGLCLFLVSLYIVFS